MTHPPASTRACRAARTLASACLCALLAGCDRPPAPDDSGPTAEWRAVGGNAGGQRFSPLTQIDAGNVARLEVAWTYHTGDVSPGDAHAGPTSFEATPLAIGDSLYLCTPRNRVIALDAETGAERWVHDPQVRLDTVEVPACRGVSYWEDAAAEAGTCARRIFAGTLDARLIALDARDGTPCAGFGEGGAIDLLRNLGPVRAGEYYPTSAPLVIGDLVVTGAFIRDGQRLTAPPGVVRAFDARSGALRWAFDPVPPGMAPVNADAATSGADFTPGTPNAWGLFSADPARGLVFVPTGNPAPDLYAGPERGEMDYYGTSVIALDAATGTPRWRFQAVHRDVWDYDIGAQPVLFEQHTAAGTRPGIVAATKMGHVFLLDRETGQPLFPVEERPVPQTTVPGARTAPTQPFPTAPPPLHPESLDEGQVWGLTPIDRAECLRGFRELAYEGMFTPPGLRRTLAWPGLGGGINWGSVSVDPGRRLMIVNMLHVPFTMQLVPRAELPGFALPPGGAVDPQEGTPYVAVRSPYNSSWGTPCVPPPWGTLSAIDLDTGTLRWQRPLGNLRKLAPLGIGRFLEWGVPNTGGSLQTASGLVFIGATLDGYFRAFDSASGQELWRHALPAPGQATPISYRLRADARQFVVIAAGGHGPLAWAAKGPERLGELQGDALVAFALPR